MATRVETKALNFTISCKGLKPNTVHDFYYKNNKATENCRSTMPDLNIGSTKLVSDSSGKLTFSFQLKVNATIKKRKFLIFSLGRDIVTLQEPPGDALFEVRAQNSVARSLVQFKNF